MISPERALLGSLLILGRGFVPPVARIIVPSDLPTERGRLVYEAILDVYASGASPDLVLVAHELDANGNMGRIGGAAALSMYVDDLPDVENVLFYARAIKADSAIRHHAARTRRMNS